ncbi:hypothetical protein BDZ94DRAFT_1176770 [Collybia nuda]|uniref:Uncharacterized protein n=1 Tax=Collybia nuda TaxID=64659 RepID=A0A9P5XU37_9AGAR|nr:hypothetical protein BDZ94DRAFT_1176770 [Collybia nuda]
MTSVTTVPENPSSGDCQIAEIVQYTCEIESNGGMNCFPIPRIFRLCSGRPAVEITRLVNIDMETGEVEVPADPSKIIVKGKAWRDVTRYDTKSDGQ